MFVMLMKIKPVTEKHHLDRLGATQEGLDMISQVSKEPIT